MRPLDPPPVVRPARLVAEVCLLCGSTSTNVPEQDCAHGRTALLSEVTSQIADLVGRVRRMRHGMAGALASLGDLVELERLAGRALVDEAPEVYPSENVVYLRRFEVCPEPTQSPTPAPPARARAAGFELKPTKPKRKVRRTPTLSRSRCVN